MLAPLYLFGGDFLGNIFERLFVPAYSNEGYLCMFLCIEARAFSCGVL